MSNEDMILFLEDQETAYYQLINIRIDELKKECADLVKHSKLLCQDRSRLTNHSHELIERHRALETQLAKQVHHLRTKAATLQQCRATLDQFLQAHPQHTTL